jgi:hypothetical protein
MGRDEDKIEAQKIRMGPEEGNAYTGEFTYNILKYASLWHSFVIHVHI